MESTEKTRNKKINGKRTNYIYHLKHVLLQINLRAVIAYNTTEICICVK